MDDPELIALREESIASEAGFNSGDVGAWMDPFHEDAVAFTPTLGFVPVSQIRAIAGDLIHTFKSFTTSNLDGRRVGDTAILFGDYAVEYADGRTERGRCTFSFVRTNGEWKTLLTHYTPDAE